MQMWLAAMRVYYLIYYRNAQLERYATTDTVAISAYHISRPQHHVVKIQYTASTSKITHFKANKCILLLLPVKLCSLSLYSTVIIVWYPNYNAVLPVMNGRIHPRVDSASSTRRVGILEAGRPMSTTTVYLSLGRGGLTLSLPMWVFRQLICLA